MSELERTMAELDVELKRQKDHGGSRYIGSGADPDVIRHVADGGTVKRGGSLTTKGYRAVQPTTGGGSVGFAKCLLDIAEHNVGHLQRTPSDWSGKALAESTNSAGGFLLPIELSSDVAQLIRANTIFDKLKGYTTVRPTGKEYDLPGLLTGASAGYLPENAAIPAATETFSILAKGYPRALATLVAVSNWLLNDAVTNPSSEAVIKQDMAAAMAVAMDQGFLFGNGLNGAPVGITTVSGLTPGPNLGANGTAPTYVELQLVPAALRSVNAPFKNPGWIFHPKFLNNLLGQTDSLGRPLYAGIPDLLSLDASTSGMSGRLLGYPFVCSTAMPSGQTVGSNSNGTSVLFSSDWDELYFLEWEGLSMAASGEASYTPDGGTTYVSSFQAYQTLFRPITRHDFQLRRPQFFTYSSGWLV